MAARTSTDNLVRDCGSVPVILRNASKRYSFRFLGIEQTPKEMLYVLQVIPKVRNKFLYRGKVWIDSQDFAVAQIEGEPAKNPSWWIRRTQIQHHYAKLDGFWLPIHNQSVSLIRLGGKAVLTIDYLDYRIMPAASVSSAQSGGGHSGSNATE